MQFRLRDWTWIGSALFAAGSVWLLFLVQSAPGSLNSEHWLAFTGSIFGGAMTLLAAGIAWSAVSNQIDAQRQLLEVSRVDKASATLTAHLRLIIEYRCLVSDAFESSDKDAPKIRDNIEMIRRKDVVLILSDPLMGKDIEAAACFFEWGEIAAKGLCSGRRRDTVERYRSAADAIYVDLVDSISDRQVIIRSSGIEGLRTLKLVEPDHHRWMVRGS